jgi:organic radical activating enzyme
MWFFFYFLLFILLTFALDMSQPEHTIPVMESFYTLQGEGGYTGSAAYFIRLGGCDVGCFWCDVKESWDPEAHPQRKVQDLIDEVEASGANIAVITGGEPTMHELSDLCNGLNRIGVRRHIETSGAHPLTGDWDWICLSPKKFKPAREEYYEMAHELKIVVYNHHDLIWAEEHAAKVNEECLLYLQPEWDKREEITPLLLNHVRDNPKWKLSLQTHKFLGIP